MPLHLDFQLIDVTTCKPLKGVYIELWSEFMSEDYNLTISFSMYSLSHTLHKQTSMLLVFTAVPYPPSMAWVATPRTSTEPSSGVPKGQTKTVWSNSKPTSPAITPVEPPTSTS